MFITALFTIAKIWKQPKWCVHQWTNEKRKCYIHIYIYIYIYISMLFIHKKEFILDIYKNMNGP